MIKVLIVDDNPFITDGLSLILKNETDFSVIAAVNQAKTAIKICQQQEIDVVLLDIRMPEVDGVAATREITNSSAAKVLILTTFDDDQEIHQVLENGASGYLLKNVPAKQIVAAIRNVATGNFVAQQDIWQKIKPQLGQSTTTDLTMLTHREQTILAAIAAGLTNRQIAKQLFISEGTVNNNISSILHKLELKHRTQLAIYYLTGQR